MAHLFNNPFLCIPSRDQVHADLTPLLDTLAQAAGCVGQGGMELDDLGSLHFDFTRMVCLFTEHGPGVFSAPVFTPEFCAELVREFASSDKWRVNDDEEEDYQIPEIVLHNEALALHGALAVHFDNLLLPMAKLLFRMDSNVIRSIQLAQYKPTEVGHGNWHIDRDSDFTVVVALSDSHRGGGTEVRPHGLQAPITVPQLPVGHALLFPGKTHLHRGMPVDSGVRNLLVFWSEIK